MQVHISRISPSIACVELFELTSLYIRYHCLSYSVLVWPIHFCTIGPPYAATLVRFEGTFLRKSSAFSIFMNSRQNLVSYFCSCDFPPPSITGYGFLNNFFHYSLPKKDVSDKCIPLIVFPHFFQFLTHYLGSHGSALFNHNRCLQMLLTSDLQWIHARERVTNMLVFHIFSPQLSYRFGFDCTSTILLRSRQSSVWLQFAQRWIQQVGVTRKLCQQQSTK